MDLAELDDAAIQEAVVERAATYPARAAWAWTVDVWGRPMDVLIGPGGELLQDRAWLRAHG